MAKVNYNASCTAALGNALDATQFLLDVGGLIPGVGEIADGVNAGIYTRRGDFVNAGLSAAACVPVAGWGATGGKVLGKGAKAVDTLGDAFTVGKKLMTGALNTDWNKVFKLFENADDSIDTLKAMQKTWEALNDSESVVKGGLDTSIKNIDEFIGGGKSFDDVLDDYAKVYADKINSNQAWSWDDTIPEGENLTKKQRSIIKQQAIDDGLIPDIKITKVEGMRYGLDDFESAGVVKETQRLPENMWKMSDAEQFKWLDEQIGGTMEGYTWHHTEISGKMQLVPTGIHNITTHNGGRTAGMWADAPR